MVEVVFDVMVDIAVVKVTVSRFSSSVFTLDVDVVARLNVVIILAMVLGAVLAEQSADKHLIL